MQAFLDECCVVESDATVRRSEIQLAWSVWCDENGHVPGSAADFGRKLRAVVPMIDDTQPVFNGQRERWYTGVCLNPGTHAGINNRNMII